LKLKNNIFIVIILSILLQSSFVFSQEIASINYDDEKGLPSNNVYFSFQDSEGKLWFATDKGVVKYNGKTFDIYTTSDGLTDNECFSIFEDSKKRIWFATFNGDPCFYYEEKFYSKKNCEFLKQSSFEGIGLCYSENKTNQFFYLSLNGIYELVNDKQFIKISHENYYFSNFYQNKEKDVFAIGHSNKKSFVLNVKSKNYQILESEKFNGFQIQSKAFCKGNYLFFFDYENLFYKNLKTGIIKQINFSQNSEKIQYVNIISNKLYIGTKNGLFISDNNWKNFKNYFHSSSISSVHEDLEKNIWITTLNEGIHFIINPNLKFYNKLSFGFDYVGSINQINDNEILFGSYDYSFTQLKNSKLISKTYKIDNDPGLIKNIKYYNENYYICSGAKFIILNKDFSIKKKFDFAVKDIEISNGYAYCVGGILIYKIPLDKFSDNDLDKFSIGKLKANGIKKISENEFLVYGSFGVKRILNGEIIDYRKEEILNKNIVDIIKTNDGVYWFASSVEGLIAVYKDNYFVFNQKNGLPSNIVNSIARSIKNEIWLGTNNGISKIDYKLIKDNVLINSSNFSSNCGLYYKDILDVLVFNNKVYTASKKGVYEIDKQLLINNKSRPLLNIVKLESNKNSTYNLKRELKIQPENNNITFYYDGVSFASLGDLKYKYRLKGMNEKWVTTINSQVNFQNLSPGHYVFQVFVIDAFNKRSVIKSVPFEKLPFFYQTWWFRIFSFFILFVVIHLIVQNRLLKMKKNHELKQQILTLENEKLKAQSKELTFQKDISELEQKALMLQMNPHFIFNSINTIQSLYKNEQEKGDEYLVQFSTLLRQILEFSKRKIISLREEISFLENYLEINKLRFENEYEYKINIDKTLNIDEIGIAPLIIQPYIENALIHGFQPSIIKGLLIINFKHEKDFIICEIIDNGVGRKRSAEINKSRLHQSMGMAITKKRLDLYNDSKKKPIIILDLEDENKNSLGTKVMLNILIEGVI
jgi:sensor histidine kinase YesM